MGSFLKEIGPYTTVTHIPEPVTQILTPALRRAWWSPSGSDTSAYLFVDGNGPQNGSLGSAHSLREADLPCTRPPDQHSQRDIAWGISIADLGDVILR